MEPITLTTYFCDVRPIASVPTPSFFRGFLQRFGVRRRRRANAPIPLVCEKMTWPFPLGLDYAAIVIAASFRGFRAMPFYRSWLRAGDQVVLAWASMLCARLM